MFSTTARSTRRVRIISAMVAAGAMIAAFSFTASSAFADANGPTITDAPVISGNLHSGGIVSATAGTWNDTDSEIDSYSWEWTDAVSGRDLSDAQTYTIDQAEIGHQLKVTVTAQDDDDNVGTTDVLSVDVAQPDFTNTVAPSITGDLTLGSLLTVHPGTWTGNDVDFQYSWGWTSNEDGGSTDPEDASTTHTTNSTDFGYYNSVNITVTDGTSTINVIAETTGLITPAAPFATDAGLTAANEGTVSGSQTTTTATVVLPAPVVNNTSAQARLGVTPAAPGVSEGDRVYVYGYSTPTPIGFFSVSATNTITVPLGALPKGLHKLAIIDSSGNLLGWLSVTAGGGLASTGVNVNAPLELGGAGLLILMGLLSVVFVARRHRKTA